MPSVMAALDVTLRRIGGAPTYVLTDNEKTVTTEHVAGVPVRNPAMVAFARHYGVTIHTCVPADPASKGGSESSVKIAKADLVPKDTNLLRAVRLVRRPRGGVRGSSVSRSTPGCTGSPAAPRWRCSPRSGPGCTRSRAARTRSRSGSPGPCRRPRRWSPSRAGSTPFPRSCSVKPCGCACTGGAADEQVVVVHVTPTGAGRGGPARAGPPRAARGSRTATSRPLRPVRWTGNRWRVTLPRSSSSRSGTAPGCG